jgi:hypothetical protein
LVFFSFSCKLHHSATERAVPIFSAARPNRKTGNPAPEPHY